MATVSLLRTNPAPSEADIARVMDRNVCRCGTYPRIVRAVKLAAERMRKTESARGATMSRPVDIEIEVERYELAEAARYRFEVERREFMRIFAVMGGGLLVFASMPGSAQESGRGGQQPASTEVSAWVHIDEQGTSPAIREKPRSARTSGHRWRRRSPTSCGCRSIACRS